jgi:hypothetical protein
MKWTVGAWPALAVPQTMLLLSITTSLTTETTLRTRLVQVITAIADLRRSNETERDFAYLFGYARPNRDETELFTSSTGTWFKNQKPLNSAFLVYHANRLLPARDGALHHHFLIGIWTVRWADISQNGQVRAKKRKCRKLFSEGIELRAKRGFRLVSPTREREDGHSRVPRIR